MRSQTLGFSYTGRICSDSRYSIAEEVGGFYYLSVSQHFLRLKPIIRNACRKKLNLKVAAHELAHNLGSAHDGDSDSISSQCSASDYYLMTPTVFVNTLPSSALNQLQMSSCSITSIKTVILSNGNSYLTLLKTRVFMWFSLNCSIFFSCPVLYQA